MIIFIFGPDEFRGRQKINELKKKFLQDVDPSGNSLNVLDGGQISSVGEIAEKCGSSSLLASKRMVVIENLFNNSSILEETLDYLKNLEEKGNENILVFWDSRVKTKKTKSSKNLFFVDASGREKPLTAKAKRLFDFLSAHPYTQEFSKLSAREVLVWAGNRIRSGGLDVSDQALRLLVGLAGADLWHLNWEIEKLIHYKKGSSSDVRAKIEVKDVEAVVSGLFDNNIFDLTDALSSKNQALALKLLEEQLSSGTNENYLLAMITRQMKILTRIRQAVDSGLSSQQISKKLNLHPFVVQKGVNQVRGFSYTELAGALNKLVDIENDLKTGQGQAEARLSLFVLRLSY